MWPSARRAACAGSRRPPSCGQRHLHRALPEDSAERARLSRVRSTRCKVPPARWDNARRDSVATPRTTAHADLLARRRRQLLQDEDPTRRPDTVSMAHARAGGAAAEARDLASRPVQDRRLRPELNPEDVDLSELAPRGGREFTRPSASTTQGQLSFRPGVRAICAGNVSPGSCVSCSQALRHTPERNPRHRDRRPNKRNSKLTVATPPGVSPPAPTACSSLRHASTPPAARASASRSPRELADP